MLRESARKFDVKVIDQSSSYPIYISYKGWSDLASLCEKQFPDHRFLIVTDSGIPDQYIETIMGILNSIDSSVDTIVIPRGERNKNIRNVDRIHNVMFKKNMGRNSILAALGGGVIGDLTGYTAAVYKRGISYIQLPTTLLSQVDSSIGGKTAVNNKFGKNMIGSFHHPSAVFINLASLETLERRHFINGLAECIKTGIVGDKTLFLFMMNNSRKILGGDKESLLFVIEHTLKFKQRIVEADYREKGIRAVLNFGHTVGHALERSSGYSLLHGEAVALGMMIESEILYKVGKLHKNDLRSIRDIIELYGFNEIGKLDRLTKSRKFGMSLMQDKKKMDQNIPLAAVEKIGKVSAENNSYTIKIKPDDFFSSVDEIASGYNLKS